VNHQGRRLFENQYNFKIINK